jgi:hypothetical protein
MSDVQLSGKEMKELEDFVINRIEDIIFKERERPSGQGKVTKYKRKVVKGKVVSSIPITDGGLLIEDDTGNLRKKLKANRGFIKQTSKGFVIDVKMVSYYKYLDDERRDKLNWYLSEAIFEDDKIKEKVVELTAGAFRRIALKMISDAAKS